MMRIYLNDVNLGALEIPITEQTTCRDVIEQCKIPGDKRIYSLVEVWRGHERLLSCEERPQEVIMRWGPYCDEVRFYLRQSKTQLLQVTRVNTQPSCVFNHEQSNTHEPKEDLKALAIGHLHQLQQRQQQLVAREQRLKYLQQQELLRHQAKFNKADDGNCNTVNLRQMQVTFSQQHRELAQTVNKVDALVRQLDYRPGNTTIHGNEMILQMLKKDLVDHKLQNDKREQLLAMHQSTLLDRQRDIDFVDQQIAHLKELVLNKNYHHSPQSPYVNLSSVTVSRSQSDGDSKPVSALVGKPVAHVIGVEQVSDPALNMSYRPWHSKSRPNDSPSNDNGRLPGIPLQQDNCSTVAGQQLSVIKYSNDVRSIVCDTGSHVNQPPITSSAIDVIKPSCGAPQLSTCPSQASIHGGLHMDTKCMYASKSVIASTYLSKRPPVIVAAVDHTIENDQLLLTGYQSIDGSQSTRQISSRLPERSESSETQYKSVQPGKQLLLQNKMASAVSTHLSDILVTSDAHKSVQTLSTNTVLTSSNVRCMGSQMSLPDTSLSFVNVNKNEFVAETANVINASWPAASSSLSAVSNNLFTRSHKTALNGDTASEILRTPVGTARKSHVSIHDESDGSYVVDNHELDDVKNSPTTPPSDINHDRVTLPSTSPASVRSSSTAIELDATAVSQSHSVEDEKEYDIDSARKTLIFVSGVLDYSESMEINLAKSVERLIVSPRPSRRKLSSDNTLVSRLSITPLLQLTAENSSTSIPESRAHRAVNIDLSDLQGNISQGRQTPSVNAIERDSKSVAVSNNVQNGIEESVGRFSEGCSLDSSYSSEVMPLEGEPEPSSKLIIQSVVSKKKKSTPTMRRVTFSPLALLLDAALEGDLDLVKTTSKMISNPSIANDEGITALHNAVCAGHYDVTSFLVEYGCDINAADSDGWTPLHCAASCSNLPIVQLLVEHGAAIFAKTISDNEIAIDKCEISEGCSDTVHDYLSDIHDKIGVVNDATVYAVYNYDALTSDELSVQDGSKLVVLRKGDNVEKEWWWCRMNSTEGYVPNNYLALNPRVPQ